MLAQNTMKTTSQLSDALEQISRIHGHLEKNEIYRGYRPIPIGIAAVAGIAAAALQSVLVQRLNGASFLAYWFVVGILCAAISSSEILFNYAFREDSTARRKSRLATGQFLPCLVAAAGVTAAVWYLPQYIPLLPGLWAVLFGLGVFASRPCLPRAIGWVALYYVCIGWWLLLHSGDADALSGWRVGGVFGAGQLGWALVLYWNVERKNAAYANE